MVAKYPVVLNSTTNTLEELQSGDVLGVPGGGTGLVSTSPYGLLAAGANSTDAFQQINGTGTAGQILISNGSGALPSWQTPAGSVAGSNTQVQYNNNGSLGGASNLVILSGGSPKFTAYRETVVTATISTTTYSIDLSLANLFSFTLAANCTFTFTNAPASGTSALATIIIKQDATGGRTASFTAAKYTDGNVPVLSTGANVVDVLTFFTVDGGTSYFGTFAMANVS